MREADGAAEEIYLLPGQLRVARGPAILRTLLGSCVGVSLWSERLRIGGLSHSLLPKRPAPRAGRAMVEDVGRVVDTSIRELVSQLERLRVVRSELEVKVFGGADVLVLKDPAASRLTVGRQNSEAALDTLEALGLVVSASSLGGTTGVDIRFDTNNGEVLLRRLPRAVFYEADPRVGAPRGDVASETIPRQPGRIT